MLSILNQCVVLEKQAIKKQNTFSSKMGDQVQTVVVDNGSGITKAGFSGENNPRLFCYCGHPPTQNVECYYLLDIIVTLGDISPHRVAFPSIVGRPRHRGLPK